MDSSNQTDFSEVGQIKPPCLGGDLLHLYRQQKFCDVILNVQTHSFPAHKVLLCARSPVFLAMFENDTKEKETGTVDITDVEPDTIELMLEFMYTDELYLGRDSAMRLYSVADKYQIELLMSKCTTFLKSCLDKTNVLLILSLADLHQDMGLKTSAIEFINNNATAVFKSEAWHAFIIENSYVAADVMKVLFVIKEMTCTPRNTRRTLYNEKSFPRPWFAARQNASLYSASSSSSAHGDGHW